MVEGCPPNDWGVQLRRPEFILAVGAALHTRVSAAERWVHAAVERTVKCGRSAFGGCNGQLDAARFLSSLELLTKCVVHRLSGGNVLRELGIAVSYTHLRAHETVLDLVCRLLLGKKQ